MIGFQGYDQWKTKSPYDDEIPEEWFDIRYAIATWHGMDVPHPESGEYYDWDGLELRIEKEIYKYWSGSVLISFDPFDAGIVELYGYAEGDQGELPVHSLLWPFTEDEYFSVFRQAEAEGIARWDEINTENKKALESDDASA